MNTKTENTPATATPSKEELVNLLSLFIKQRPGFEWQNYAGAPAAYRADYARALRDKKDAEALLFEVSRRSGITAENITEELSRGGRLEWSGGLNLHYTAGQYFPTEYRAAACRVLASILWNYFRNVCTAESTGECVRWYARKELKRHGRLASRWFN